MHVLVLELIAYLRSTAERLKRCSYRYNAANPGPKGIKVPKRPKIGPNWYGTNKYTTRGLNQTGPGTICPRIHTTLIPYNISCISQGKYEVTFYNNGSIASKLPDLTTYFVLNYNTDKEEVIEVVVHQEKLPLSFQLKIMTHQTTL